MTFPGGAGLIAIQKRSTEPSARGLSGRFWRCRKGALSQDTARLMVFKLVMAAARTWRRLKGENQLPKVVQGVTFRNGVEVTDTPAQSAA